MAALDEEERAHLEELRAIDRRNLRILDRQIRTYGEENAPPYMIARRDELREKLGITGKMIRGEYGEDILDLLRQFGERQSLSRAIADVGKDLYDFKKETWDYREREAVTRKERQHETDTTLNELRTKVDWIMVIGLIIVALVVGAWAL